MNPTNLIRGASYLYTPTGCEAVELTYRHRTINHWAFDKGVTEPIILLHTQQILKDISEIETT